MQARQAARTDLSTMPHTDSTASALAKLRLEHRDLDLLIARLHEVPVSDELAIKRLKKRKLRLKDMIAHLQSRLIPDLDA